MSQYKNIKYNKMIMRIIYINNKATIPIKGGVLEWCKSVNKDF